MTKLETLKIVLCEQFGVHPELIEPTSNLEKDLALDSLDLVEAAMSIEDATDLDIPDQALYECKTVQDILDMWERIEQKA